MRILELTCGRNGRCCDSRPRRWSRWLMGFRVRRRFTRIWNVDLRVRTRKTAASGISDIVI